MGYSLLQLENSDKIEGLQPPLIPFGQAELVSTVKYSVADRSVEIVSAGGIWNVPSDVTLHNRQAIMTATDNK